MIQVGLGEREVADLLERARTAARERRAGDPLEILDLREREPAPMVRRAGAGAAWVDGELVPLPASPPGWVSEDGVVHGELWRRAGAQVLRVH